MPIQLGTDQVPLKSITYNLKVNQFTCKLLIAQTFTNATACNSELIYTFPFHQTIAVTSFQVETPTNNIQGKIVSTSSAAQIYTNAKVAGNDAFLLESLQDGKKLNILIGSIPQGENVTVKLDCVFFPYMENDFWTIKLPPILSEVMHAGEHAYNIANVEYSLDAELASLNPFNNINISHQAEITYNSDKTKATIKVSVQKTTGQQDKDIVLQYTYDKIGEPLCVCEYSDTYKQYTYAMCLYPPISGQTGGKGSGEYIFFLDVSGSMSGKRIDLAVEALKLFLRSIPENSKFNVVLFSTSYQMYFKESVIYNEATMVEALQKLEAKNFDFGGTTLFAPLQHIISQPIDPKYPRILFILTDGQVGSTEQIIELINEKSSTHIVNTIGIGEGADTRLIIGAATAGRGSYRFINELNVIPEKVIELLSPFVRLSYTQIDRKWPQTPLLEYTSATLPTFTYAGRPLFVTGIFNDKLTQPIELSYKESASENEKKFDLTGAITFNDNSLIKLAAHNYCIKEANCQDIAIKYEILSNYTSFIAVVKNTSLKTEETIIINKSASYTTLFSSSSLPVSSSPSQSLFPAAFKSVVTGSRIGSKCRQTPRMSTGTKGVSTVAARRAGPATGGIQKPHRYLPGTVALREIRKYQNSTEFLIRKSNFNRLVREIGQDYRADLRFQKGALEAIQDEAESFIAEMFTETNLIAIHAGRDKIFPKDLQLMFKLRQHKYYLPDFDLSKIESESNVSDNDQKELQDAEDEDEYKQESDEESEEDESEEEEKKSSNEDEAVEDDEDEESKGPIEDDDGEEIDSDDEEEEKTPKKSKQPKKTKSIKKEKKTKKTKTPQKAKKEMKPKKEKKEKKETKKTVKKEKKEETKNKKGKATKTEDKKKKEKKQPKEKKDKTDKNNKRKEEKKVEKKEKKVQKKTVKITAKKDTKPTKEKKNKKQEKPKIEKKIKKETPKNQSRHPKTVTPLIKNESKKEVKTPNKSIEEPSIQFESILKCQKATGMFDEVRTMALLSVDETTYDNHLPASLTKSHKKGVRSLWATILMICLISKYSKMTKRTSLIREKAEDKMQDEKIDYKDYEDEAEAALKAMKAI